MTHSDSYRRILARMGYYDYQNGLIFRHINQEGGWDSHLGKSRDFILRMIGQYKPRKITVLGSGWLLELPIAEIAELADEIVLVDIIHPPEVIKQAAGLKNVSLVEDDVTGGLIEAVWKTAHGFSLFRKSVNLKEISIPEYNPGYSTGMVISLNLITQLESLLVDYLKKKIKSSEQDYLLFRREIQKKHIQFLSRNRSVLVTDFEEVFIDNKGKETIVPTLLAGLPDAQHSEEWKWNFDMKGADNYNSTSYMRVLAKVL